MAAQDVLDPIHHARIIEDIEHVAATANIAVKYVRESARPYCSAKELDWLIHYHAHVSNGVAGLVVCGLQSTAPDLKLMALTGALVRQFIDARFMALNTLLETAVDGDALTPRVLLVPNLLIESVGRSMPSWKVQVLYDVLLGRLTAAKPSVLYVENWDLLKQVYGPAFAQHLEAHYVLA